MARARVTPARAHLDTPYAHESAEAARVAMLREGRCPETFEGRLAWLARVWADEPMPDAIHGAGVWTGPQRFDRRGDPKTWPTMNGSPEWPDELVGGSAIGSPRIIEPFRRYVEGAMTELDRDGFYRRPLAAALTRLSRGNRRRQPSELAALTIFAVLRARGDWHAIARRGKWAEEMFQAFLSDRLGVLWHLYEPFPPRDG